MLPAAGASLPPFVPVGLKLTKICTFTGRPLSPW